MKQRIGNGMVNETIKAMRQLVKKKCGENYAAQQLWNGKPPREGGTRGSSVRSDVLRGGMSAPGAKTWIPGPLVEPRQAGSFIHNIGPPTTIPTFKIFFLIFEYLCHLSTIT